MSDVRKALEAARIAAAQSSDDDCRFVQCSNLEKCWCHREAHAAVLAFLQGLPDMSIPSRHGTDFVRKEVFQRLAAAIEKETQG